MKKLIVLLLVLCCCGSLFAEKYDMLAQISPSGSDYTFTLAMMTDDGKEYGFTCRAKSDLTVVFSNHDFEKDYVAKSLTLGEGVDPGVVVYKPVNNIDALLVMAHVTDADDAHGFLTSKESMIAFLKEFFKEGFIVFDKTVATNLENIQETEPVKAYIEYLDYLHYLDAKDQFERFVNYFL